MEAVHSPPTSDTKYRIGNLICCVVLPKATACHLFSWQCLGPNAKIVFMSFSISGTVGTKRFFFLLALFIRVAEFAISPAKRAGNRHFPAFYAILGVIATLSSDDQKPC